MIIQYKRTKQIIKCAICKKSIAKGKIYVKYEQIIDGWKNTRMWFAHIRCLILKLLTIQSKLEKEKKEIPITSFNIERYEGK